MQGKSKIHQRSQISGILDEAMQASIVSQWRLGRYAVTAAPLWNGFVVCKQHAAACVEEVVRKSTTGTRRYLKIRCHDAMKCEAGS
jgi:hypothetical protein